MGVWTIIILLVFGAAIVWFFWSRREGETAVSKTFKATSMV